MNNEERDNITQISTYLIAKKYNDLVNYLEIFPNYIANMDIFIEFITEIQKNNYNKKQLIAIARFLYQLANLKNVNISANPIKTDAFSEIYNHLKIGFVNNARFNNTTKGIISKFLEKFNPFNSNSNDNQKLQYIIKQFIAQYLSSFEFENKAKRPARFAEIVSNPNTKLLNLVKHPREYNTVIYKPTKNP